MVLIVNGVCRYALNQSYEARTVVNIVDMQIDTTGSIMSRETAVFNQAGQLINAWVDQMLPALSDDLVFDSVSWVDLDEPDGSTGSRVTTSEHSLPLPGQSAAGTFPGNVSMLVTKQIEGNRARRNGRMYVAGLNESVTGIGDPNRIEAATVTAFQTRVSDFQSQIESGPAGADSYDSQMVVTHITERDAEGNPTAGVYSPVVSLIPNALLATQRRRLRG